MAPVCNGSFGIPADQGGYPAMTVTGETTIDESNWVIEESRSDEQWKIEAEILLDQTLKSDLDTLEKLSSKWISMFCKIFCNICLQYLDYKPRKLWLKNIRSAI